MYQAELKAKTDFVNQLDYARAEGRAEGEARGEARGRLNTKRITVFNLHDMGMNIDFIAKAVLLTKEEVKEILKSK